MAGRRRLAAAAAAALLCAGAASAVSQKPLRSNGVARGTEIGTLVLLRHGESIWNIAEDERFTGWTDVPLTRRGEFEATAAGKTLQGRNIEIETVHTSLLQRAGRTMELALASCAHEDVRVKRSWRLNERHYGALQGLNKAQAALDIGEAIVHEWRRSWEVPPPLMGETHPLWDSIYGHPMYDGLDVSVEKLPRGESVAQCAARLEPYWFSHIVPSVRSGRTTMVVAHANSLRALMRIMFRRQVTDAQIRTVKIPTGVPLIYRLEERPVLEEDLTAPSPEDPIEGLSETPDYDLVPRPPPPGFEGLTGEMLWPLEECPTIWHDWKLQSAIDSITEAAIQAAAEDEAIQMAIEQANRRR